jgi:pSer/pThr/pTyr-binding forkhead associated (FHA) protein
MIALQLQPLPTRRLGLVAGQMIGRDQTCDIRLDDPMVSRRHALLVDHRGKLAIEDLGSANGILVNGVRTRRRQPLRIGDVIQIGGAIWKVV